jgi:hypothetical protein
MDKHDEKEPDETPTDVLIKCLEDADDIETVLVIASRKSGSLSWNTNTDSISLKLGMIELAKQAITYNAFKDENED